MGPKVSPATPTERFRFVDPRRFNSTAYFYIPLFLVLCGSGILIGFKSKDLLLIWVGSLCLLLAAYFFFYLHRIKNSKIEIHFNRILLIKDDGSTVSIPWSKLVSVREQAGGADLILQGRTPDLKIRISPLLENFDRARERILEEWVKARPPETLPTNYRTSPFRSVGLDSKGIGISLFFRRTDLAWGQIESIRWGFKYFLDPRLRMSFVRITARDGRVFVLVDRWGNLPEIYGGLKHGWLQSRRGVPEPEKGPIHLTEEKLSKNLWLAALAGALWVVVPAIFIGKFLMGNRVLYYFALQCVVLIGISYKALKRESRVFRTELPRQEVHPLGAAILILCAWLSGSLLTNEYFSHQGEKELSVVKARVTKAGYDLRIPAKESPIPDRDNAVYYLKKVAQDPSAGALIYNDRGKKDMPWAQVFYDNKTQQNILDKIMKDLEKGQWSPLDNGLALRLLAAHQDSIRLLEAASHARGIDWGTDFSIQPSYRIESPSMPGFLNWDHLLISKAYLQAKQGRGKAALATLKTCLVLGDAACRSKFFIGEVIGESIYRTTLARAPFILSQVPASLVEKEWIPCLDSQRMIQGFKASEVFENFIRYQGMEHFNRWGNSGPFRAHSLAVFYEAQLQILEAFELPYSQQKAVVDRVLRDFGNRQWFIWPTLQWNSFAAHNKLLESIAYIRLARASVEARLFHQQNHRWPEKVEEISSKTGGEYLDPFADRDNLRITPKGNGIQISSVGPDEWGSGGDHWGSRPLIWVVDKE